MIDGEPVSIRNPRDAKALNIETIYQTLALADNIDAPGNLFLGRELTTRIGSLDDSSMESETRKIMGRLNPNFTNFAQPVKSLSGGQRQAVAIARAVYFNARILIMDEPTAALGPAETAQVRNLVRQLKDEGIGIFLISHDIHDVFDLSDRISVMYHGRIVDTVNKNDVTAGRRSSGMIILGKKPDEVTEKELGRACELRALDPASARAYEPAEDRRQGRVELAVARVGLGVARDVRARARRPGSRVTRAAAAASTLREPAGADRGQQPGPVGRALGRVDRGDLGVEHVGQDLPPERAGRAAARRPDLGRRRHPGRDHQVEPVAQAERHALEDGAGQVAPVVGEGQPDERAAGERVGVRAALAGEVGQEQQARRSPAGTSAARADERRRTPRPGRARRGTSAGCRPPRASPTSGASDPGRRGRRRGRGRAARRAVGPSWRTRRPTSRARAPSSRPRPRPTPTALAAWSPPPATTGVPARSPVAAAASAVTVPVTSGPSNVGGIQAGSMPSAASTSGDQSRAARSNRSVPAPSALSSA